MSLIQCENCGCVENTALTSCCMWGPPSLQDIFNWEGKEHLKGKKLCSACAPEKFTDGTDTDLGKWHDEFERKFLPLGEFETDEVGNLRHKSGISLAKWESINDQ